MKIVGFRVNNKKSNLHKSYEKMERQIVKYGLPIVTAFATMDEAEVYAAKSIRDGFKPIITTLQDLAEPVALAFLIFGGIKLITGKTMEGKKTMANAVGGYIVIQWIPWLFEIIRNVGR